MLPMRLTLLAAAFVEECKASIARIGEHPDKNDLLRWWNSEVEKKKRRDFDLSPAEVIELKGTITARKFQANERREGRSVVR